MDPFDDHRQEILQPLRPQVDENQFPNFNTKWLPQFDEGIKTKTGKNLEKGSDILKKASKFYFFVLGVSALLMILPAIIRFVYEFSSWAYGKAGNIFP